VGREVKAEAEPLLAIVGRRQVGGGGHRHQIPCVEWREERKISLI
jgi:hypothetical protein